MGDAYLPIANKNQAFYLFSSFVCEDSICISIEVMLFSFFYETRNYFPDWLIYLL